MFARLLTLVFATAVLAGCGTIKNKQTLLETTLETYASVIRWGNFEEAMSFIDPEALKGHPVTALDLQRYRQVQVTVYSEQKALPVGENEVRQMVEIGVVNVNTQSARTLLDNQLWRYDAQAKRWWLMSGLPDITAH
jgi:uncharacterized protein YceK